MFKPTNVFFLNVYSQNTAIGVKGGINTSYLTGPNAPALSERQIGYNAGIFMRFRISDVMTVRPALSYTQKRYTFTHPIYMLQNGILSVDETNSYLSLPVMFTFQKGDNVINTFFCFGPEIALFVNNERKLKATSNGHDITAEAYYDFDISKYDYGASVGAGFQFKGFIFDARFFISLHPLYKGDNSLEMRYMNLVANLGYIINYRPAASFSRPTTWKSFKYKLKHIFK